MKPITESTPAISGHAVHRIPLGELHAFQSYPNKILENEPTFALVDSILEHGVIVPALARPLLKFTIHLSTAFSGTLVFSSAVFGPWYLVFQFHLCNTHHNIYHYNLSQKHTEQERNQMIHPAKRNIKSMIIHIFFCMFYFACGFFVLFIAAQELLLPDLMLLLPMLANTEVLIRPFVALVFNSLFLWGAAFVLVLFSFGPLCHYSFYHEEIDIGLFFISFWVGFVLRTVIAVFLYFF